VAIRPRERFLTTDEVAFSGVPAANEIAVKAMVIPETQIIVAELVPHACKDVTID
jgi:hypothetical protein